MPKKHTIHFVETFGNTGYHVNDLGENKSPRFELYYEPEEKVIFKTNNPNECTKWIQENIWKEFYESTKNIDEPKPKSKNSRTKT